MTILELVVVSGSRISGLTQGSEPDIPWIRIGLVLALCIALAIAAIGFVRLRHGLPFLPERFAGTIGSEKLPPDHGDRLAIIDRLAAGPNSQFVVLARGEQRYLLHVTSQGVTEIDRFCEDIEEETR